LACSFDIGSADDDPPAEAGEEDAPEDPAADEPAAELTADDLAGEDPAEEDPADVELELGEDPVLQPLTTNTEAVRAAITDLCTAERMTDPFVCEGSGLR
jgi:hypothetical protein